MTALPAFSPQLIRNLHRLKAGLEELEGDHARLAGASTELLLRYQGMDPGSLNTDQAIRQTLGREMRQAAETLLDLSGMDNPLALRINAVLNTPGHREELQTVRDEFSSRLGRFATNYLRNFCRTGRVLG